MAQFLPDAPELLTAIGRLLHDKVLPAVPSELQHQVRVAANLAGILAREAGLGSAGERRQRELTEQVLGRPLAADEDPAGALDSQLSGDIDGAHEARAWAALVEMARDDLAICKPGHDAYEGA